MTNSHMKLPHQVVTRDDVLRLLQEINQVDQSLQQATDRVPGTASAQLPKTSRLLNLIAEEGQLNLLLQKDRLQLIGFLTAVKVKAPTFHISFAAEPSPQFMQKLISWFREEIDPLILLQPGLQPTIGAGCVVSGNKLTLDFSLRRYLQGQRPKLQELLKTPERTDASLGVADIHASAAAPLANTRKI